MSMNEEQLEKYRQEAFHSQRMLAWLIIEFIFLIILGICICYCRS